MQWLALSLAALGVLYPLVEYGSLPWVSLLVFGHQSLQTDLLLAAAGLVTTFPLCFYR